MAIDLIAIDLDGTLLTSNKQITPRALEAILRANEMGLKVVIASARPPRAVKPLYERCCLRTVEINYNGALIWDPNSQQALLHRPLMPETVRAVVDFARDRFPATLVSLEVIDQWYTDRFDERYASDKSLVPNQVAPIDELLASQTGITKLMLLGDPADSIELEKLLAARFARQVALVRNDQYLIQVMHPTAGKGAALRAVAQMYQIDRERVMAIGDAPNDLGMIQWAGLGVAVHNAHPLVRRAADYITASNDEDGVAEALEMFVVGPGAG